MDKTVRLWHVTRNECLCVFKHNDFVTSIEFHPRDDRFFLAGSLDSKLRLWSIPDKSVAFIANLPDMITAVAFTPDGKYSIAGCLNGLCQVFHTDGLKVQSQIHVRSARGKNAKGSKITGIDTIAHPPESDNVKLLITSNDSRIRLYNFKDRTLDAKFRGNENANSQIHASFSNDGRYIICGSEDRRAYIWPLGYALRDADKRPVETFEAHNSIVTTAVFAPTKTKQVLGSSGDLLYDLCNPPPVTLVSQAPSVASKQPAEDEGSGEATPRTSTRPNQPKAEESPTYLARSKHPGGNIIVTADFKGNIKVFRQDCGYHKRRHETWDRNSTFSRKLLGRASSVSTRRSIASSLGKESHHKTPSDRILSWRSGVVRNHDNPSVENVRSNASQRTRSISPSKSLRRGSPAQQSDMPRAAAAGASRAVPKPVLANPFSGAQPDKGENGQTPATEEQQESNPLWLAGDQSYMFWNTARRDAARAGARGNRRQSLLSLDHSDMSSMSSDMLGEGEDAQEGVEADEVEELSCSRCAGTNFRAMRSRQGDQRLICTKCGAAAADS
jgi:WD40 repeat protein